MLSGLANRLIRQAVPQAAIPLAALAFLVCGPAARGAEVSAKGEPGAVSPAHDGCRCKSCKGASSCCCASGAHAKHSTTLLASRSTPRSEAEPAQGPCVRSIPCGGDGETPAPAAGSVTWNAALPDAPAVHVSSTSSAVVAIHAPLVSALSADRPADPPERRGAA